MIKNFVMLSGLPRSGSTVLSSMLNQHTDIHATTTSPIADLLIDINIQWPNISQALRNPHVNQHTNIIRGALTGAMEHISEPVIVDKNRLWPRCGDFMEPVLGYKPKIICTVRDIPDILASYILLIEKNNHKVTFVDESIVELGLPINNKNRCKVLWEKYVQHPYTSLRIGYGANNVELLFVEYADIVENGQSTVDRICDFIGVNRYTLSTTTLQPMEENDQFHGGMDGLHHIRPVLAKTSPSPEKVIGHELTNYYRSLRAEFWRK